MTSNLDLWDKVRRVPEEHLKAFKRSGGFAGTAIKPMWGIKTMTEQFGPCGLGWGIEKPEFQIVDSGNEKLVFCTVCVWYGSSIDMKGSLGEPIKLPASKVYGVGGDKVLAQFSSGLKPDDEAFKKAFTDAIGNALKFIGVAADIHMGLWDGNKYVDEEPASKQKPAMPKAEAKPEYSKISSGIRQIKETGTDEDLTAWYRSHVKIIEAMDAGWTEKLMAEFTEARASIRAKAA
jgi:hypothetical protein